MKDEDITVTSVNTICCGVGRG